MSRIIRIAHLARVEGHGGITIEVERRRVKRAHFDVFEGLRLVEGLLRGRQWMDVSQIVSRICSICSVGHALTSIKATEAAFGITPSWETTQLRNLMFHGESIESHALHVFLLAAPDYLGYPSAIAMAEDYPDTVAVGLRLKKLGNLIQETVGGRAIHPVNAVVGGFGRAMRRDELLRMRDALLEGLRDSEAAVDFVATLAPAETQRGELLCAALRPGTGYGYYDGDKVIFRDGEDRPVTANTFREVIREEAVAHSNAKHSRLDGRAFMVGALARLTVNGAALGPRAAAAMGRMGLTLPSLDPLDNNRAQTVELVQDIDAALTIIQQLLDSGTGGEVAGHVEPRAGSGVAVTEAPRGLLLHSYEYDEDGSIVAADVITPTALNAAHLEESLARQVEQSRAIDDGALRRDLEMIARAYDPCISCSVHLVRLDDRSTGEGPGS